MFYLYRRYSKGLSRDGSAFPTLKFKAACRIASADFL